MRVPPDPELRRLVELLESGLEPTEALRQYCGRLRIAFRYPDKRSAGIAYQRAFEKVENASFWRLLVREGPKDVWAVVGIAERKAPIAKIRRLANVAGAVEVDADEFLGEETISGVRERRLEGVLLPGIREARGQRKSASFGLGVLIDRHGGLSPYRRPQG